MNKTPPLREALESARVFIESLHPLDEADESEQSLPEIVFSETNLEEMSLGLSGAEAASYRRCTQILFASAARNGDISARSVEKLFQSAILESLDLQGNRRGDDFKSRLSRALKGLGAALRQKPIRRHFHIRVRGLASEGLPFEFGDTTFEEFSVSAVEDLRKLEFSEPVLQRLEEAMVGRLCGKTKVKSRDFEAGLALAKRKLQGALDTINFFSDIVPYNHAWLHIGSDLREGEYTPALDEDKSRGFVFSQRIGPLGTFSIQRLRSFDRRSPVGFSRVCELAAKNSKGKMDKALLTATRWAGRATTCLQKEESFLLYAVALESLLLPGIKGELKYRLQVRIAHFLADDLATRQEIAQRLNRAYSIRSKIVHEGHADITDDDLGSIRWLAKSSISRALTDDAIRDMSSIDQFNAWLEKKVLL